MSVNAIIHHEPFAASRGLLIGLKTLAPQVSRVKSESSDVELSTSTADSINPKMINSAPSKANLDSFSSGESLKNSTDSISGSSSSNMMVKTKNYNFQRYRSEPVQSFVPIAAAIHQTNSEHSYQPEFAAALDLLDERSAHLRDWIEIMHDENLRYYHHKTGKGTNVFNKFYAKLKNVDPEKLYQMLVYPNKSKYYKDKLQETLIEQINDYSEIVHTYKKMPPLMDDRDSVIVRFHIDSEKHPELIIKYGLQSVKRPFKAIYHRSIPRDDIPIKKNVIRSDSILFGMIIQPDPMSPKNAFVQAVSHSDYKGGVPDWLMQKYSSHLPKKVLEAFQDAYKKWIEDHH